MRNTRAVSSLGVAGHRFVPAYAGNTIAAWPARCNSPVNPRMRGEHVDILALGMLTVGSSPHARGTPNPASLDPQRGRFIPACAGNTRGWPARCWDQAVHPRMRGEHKSKMCIRIISTGSSPHARGTHQCSAAGARQRRFIPACAGNTSTVMPAWSFSPVHPRMRGEHLVDLDLENLTAGSSPHARGTLLA